MTYLEQDHTQTDTLDGIQDTKPQPQRDAEMVAGVACPWQVETHGRRSPQHLTPPRGAETDSEDGQQPGMRLREVGEDEHEEGPYEDEEHDDEDNRLPDRDRYRPQVRPVASIRLHWSVSAGGHQTYLRHLPH